MKNEINPVAEFHLAPTIEWMMNHTSASAVFMNVNPPFYAWLADRAVVEARYFNVTQLYKTINEFHVDYLIIDNGSPQYLPEIYNYIKLNWTNPLPGFSLSFYQQFSSNVPEVLVYNVSDTWKFSVSHYNNKLEMLNSTWQFRSSSGIYNWEVKDDILNMTVSFNSSQDEWVLLEHQLPESRGDYSLNMSITFKVYGKAPQFTLELFDSNNSRLVRSIDYRQTTDWYTVNFAILQGSAYFQVGVSKIPKSVDAGVVTVLIQSIEVSGYTFNYNTLG